MSTMLCPGKVGPCTGRSSNVTAMGMGSGVGARTLAGLTAGLTAALGGAGAEGGAGAAPAAWQHSNVHDDSSSAARTARLYSASRGRREQIDRVREPHPI